jgi:hypothetical protein
MMWVIEMEESVNVIFKKPPARWFLRGEPFLWDDLEKLYSQYNLPISKERFEDILDVFMTKLLKEAEYKHGIIYVKRYAHGGMSSGCINLIDWELKRRPYILKLLDEANNKCKKTNN